MPSLIVFRQSLRLKVKNPTPKGVGLRSQIHKFGLDQPKSKEVRLAKQSC
ncbi:hypothetical protein CCP3SC5AM1_1170007 [Gammaproteobacteria bacterium]